MNTRILGVGLAAAAVMVAGCGKKDETQAGSAPTGAKGDTIAIVKQEERSAHFLAVNRHLEVGGTLYGYVDIDGDVMKLAGNLQGFASQIADAQPQAAALKNLNYEAIVRELGLDGIKAVGLSSVPDGSGYFRNTAYVHIPGKRRGLMAGFGGAPGPFARLNLAPADADIYAETEVDLPVVYSTVLKVADIVAGEETSGKIEAALTDAGRKATFSVLSLIQQWKGHMALVVRVDPQANFEIPAKQRVRIPAFSFLISIDGIAPTLRDTIINTKMFNVRTEGSLEVFEFQGGLPFHGVKPVFAIEGSTLYLATSVAFLADCRGTTPRLADSPEFQEAIARVGTVGNGLHYYSPKLFRRLGELGQMNSHLPAESTRALEFLLKQMPQPDRPLVSVRSNVEDGILIHSYWNRSLKQDVAGIAVYNPVTIGVLAAMAIPAFNKVRETSQQKAVLNNLRQLSGAAEQYFMETGKTSATYDDLVGPRKYIRAMNPVAGEDYRSMRFSPGATLRVRLASGKVVTFEP